MSDWWTVPYKGGPMAVPASMFPRPLYPPDAAAKGKNPSVAGPDVEAYKRTVSRAGRWPWQPFDRVFSNGFSHGKGGNVIDSGVAGVQRQMNISDTGWIGQQTFNVLASIRVPEGRPHAGEMAMDVTACNLVALAFEQYGGEPAPPASSTPQRKLALAAAVEWLGYVETGNNHTIFGEWYGMDYQPWCAMFVTHCFVIGAGHDGPSFVRANRYSYVPYVVNDAKAGRHGLTTTRSPIPGDLVCFDWELDGLPDHIGLFESGNTGSFVAIEGNTSPADNSNGGQVMRRQRGGTGVTFVRVAG